MEVLLQGVCEVEMPACNATPRKNTEGDMDSFEALLEHPTHFKKHMVYLCGDMEVFKHILDSNSCLFWPEFHIGCQENVFHAAFGQNYILAVKKMYSMQV